MTFWTCRCCAGGVPLYLIAAKNRAAPVWLVKVTADGAAEWQTSILPSRGSPEAYHIAAGPGGVYVVGLDNGEATVRRYSTAGDLLATAILKKSDGGRYTSSRNIGVACDSAGNVFTLVSNVGDNKGFVERRPADLSIVTASFETASNQSAPWSYIDNPALNGNRLSIDEADNVRVAGSSASGSGFGSPRMCRIDNDLTAVDVLWPTTGYYRGANPGQPGNAEACRPISIANGGDQVVAPLYGQSTPSSGYDLIYYYNGNLPLGGALFANVNSDEWITACCTDGYDIVTNGPAGGQLLQGWNVQLGWVKEWSMTEQEIFGTSHGSTMTFIVADGLGNIYVGASGTLAFVSGVGVVDAGAAIAKIRLSDRSVTWTLDISDTHGSPGHAVTPIGGNGLDSPGLFSWSLE